MLHDGNSGLIGSRYILVIGSLHLELVHALLGLGDVQLVGRIVAHDRSLLLSFGKRLDPRRNQIAFRGSIMCGRGSVMIG